MKKHLKILSIIGAVLIIIAFSSTYNPSQYILETLGIIALGAYAWEKIHDRIVMLWVSGFFAVWFTFFVPSFPDILFWVLAFAFLYKDK